ncbi:Transcriptional regulatory protein ZraR [Dorea longicatena]|uniref:Transcriptional regulatory protein ZraR n=1 Tax=Dorea longicatena TaxID=88431 RepID=A0A173QWA6_9FIRM|nr:sigma 54-interacting transcriptional regulator [Dorea longicatena]CUM69892.1 Transcriptional regulatory protein ZraR [Dorea longicatena]
MEAKEEIYQYIRKNIKEDGVTAQSIAEIFGIKRNVASHYLNLLEKEGKLQKGTNRPVHFSIPTDTEKKAEECNNMIDERPVAQKEVSVFSKFIGYNGSMEQVIEKCKAAVNYPVNGLTMIICGASGVGKSYLASLIHQYAVESGAVEKNAPFVVLNCADYANNSELLSSVLFGHVKGAFTGANEEKQGLLAEADGGYLFLDEVHNLSAENQEKLFLFIDSQKYRMLGDSKNWQTAKVRLLFATTEDIHSTLLATFRRRIPFEIRIPDFLERSYGERFLLVSSFFQNEAEILKKNICVDSEYFRRMLNLHEEGNIGAVKSKIKVLCAQAYSQQREEELRITTPGKESSDSFHFYWNRPEKKKWMSSYQIFSNITGCFVPGMNYSKIEEVLDLFLQTITRRLEENKKENNFCEIPPFRHYEEKCRNSINKILKSYGYRLNELEIDEFYKMVIAVLFDETFFGAAFKISGYEKKKYRKYEVMISRILDAVLEDYNDNVREFLQTILTVWLSDKVKVKSKINALILMHGEHSASSMASLANEMIGDYVYEAFDMPIQVHTEDLIVKVDDYVRDIETNEGLVLLVDMGSLERMYDKISRNVAGDLVIVNNVSTAFALELGFSLFDKADIYRITQMDMLQFNMKMQYYKGLSQKPNIIVSCISGEGIAVEIKEILSRYVNTDEIDILTMDYSELKKQLNRGSAEDFHNTIVVFTTTPLSSTVVSVMNVEDLVNGFTNPSFPEFMLNKENVREFTNDIIKLFTLKGVASRLRFLNPEVVMQEVDQVIRGYENYYHVQLPNFLRINLFLHTSIMIERVLVKEESGKIDSIDTEGINEESRKFIEVSKDIFKSIMMKYKIEISDAEYLLLYQILQSVIQK